MGSKFGLLARHLEQSNQDLLRLSFKEIENIIKESLPPSAFEHRAWWSNSLSHSHAKYGWMAVGYETGKVDMDNRTLVFYRSTDQTTSQYPNSVIRSAPSGGTGSLGRRSISDAGLLIRKAGGIDNALRIFDSIQEYIQGDISENELGQAMRRLWPRR